MTTGPAKSNSVRLTLQGGDEYVSLSAFLEAAGDVKDILRALGAIVSPSEGAGLEWAVIRSYISSFHIEVACIANPAIGSVVAQTFVDGLDVIEKRAERPPLFDDYILDKAKHLSTIVNRDDVDRIVVGSGPTDVHVSQHIAANVTTLIGPRYEEIGAVEGRIEGVNIHRRNTCNIYEFTNERRIECSFDEELLGDVVAALGKRAIVYGIVRTNVRGQPVSVRIERIEIMRSREDLPSIADLRGIDPEFTGGKDAAEYVRMMRDAS
jgi:hypothetical protein